MTDLVITEFGDTWVNADRPGHNYSDTNAVRVMVTDRFGLLLPELPNLLGRTVTEAYLVGYSGEGLDAQTLTLAPFTSRRSPGTATFDNLPDVNAAAAVAFPIAARPADTPVEITGLEPIFQAVADGTDWFGLRLATDAVASQHFWSSDSGRPAWELHLSLSDAVAVPEGLRPNGGAVGSANPTLAWDPVDVDGGQTHSRVQVDTPAIGVEPDGTTPDYDSALAVNPDPQWSLVGEHTLVGTGPHYFRVNVDPDGDPDGWSDWAEFRVVALPAIVMDSPVVGGTFGDPSPLILAHLSSGTLTTWKAKITGPDRSDVRIRRKLTDGPISWQVPFRYKGRRVVRDGGWLYLEAADNEDRTDAVGSPSTPSVWVQLLLAEDALLEAPSGFTLRQTAKGDPRHVWSWSRTEAAEAWLILVDGEVVARLEPEDVTASGGSYTWTDSGEISPLRPHTIGVRAVDAGKRSKAAEITGYSYTAEGVWLLPDDPDIAPIVLSGTAVGDFASEDATTTHKTLTGEQVDVRYGTPGVASTFAGQVSNTSGADVWATLDALEALRTGQNRLARMVWGSRSAMVRLRSPQSTPDGDILPNNLLHNVRFGFVELPS